MGIGKRQAIRVTGNEFGAQRRAFPVEQVEPVRPILAKSATAEALKAMEDQIREAQQIVLSLPKDRTDAWLRGSKSCLGSIVISEPDGSGPDVIGTAKQITRALNLIELLVSLQDIDPFAVKVVLLRAMKKPAGWKRISELDPRGRGRRQLYNLQREVLGALYEAIQNKKLRV